MAANIQMIFYRKEGTADILVRILHNEHEMYLPLASARPPYYKWDDLRAFYHRRIAEAKGTAAVRSRLPEHNRQQGFRSGRPDVSNEGEGAL